MRAPVTLTSLVLLLPLTALGCKDDPKPTPTPTSQGTPSASASAAPPRSMDTKFLDDAARRVLSEIATLETTKDVTCWTSFRQLDSFISSGQYSNFAVLAKITAVKALLRAAWEKASLAAPGAELTAEDFAKTTTVAAATLDEKKTQALASFATDLGMKAYKDYRTTSEHWRVVLSVITDEIAASGKGTNLKPLGKEALASFAELATRISLAVLQASGELAKEERSPFIEGTHVKRAHSELSRKLYLVNAETRAEKLPDAELTARLSPLTKTLIEGKITALQTYNKDSKDLVTDLNRVTPKMPVTKEALDVWTRDLQSFTHFVAGGYEPMQADNFLADGNFAPKDQPRQAYVEAARAENSTMQLFPHLIMPNGDVKLRFEPNPGSPGDRPRKPWDELMKDYQQNAVRDTAWHWILMQNVWKERAFAMDPFAAEYVSEVLSMMVTHYLVHGAELARAQKKTQIDAAIAREVRERDYVMVTPHTEEAVEWTAEQRKKKDAVLSAYPKTLFADVSAKAGLSTSAPKIPEKASGFDIQEAMGSGIAVGDLNADGYPDLFIAGEGMGRLYLNKGKDAPGTFTDATDAWHVPTGLDDSHGALFTDLDGDGSVDLLVMRSEHPSLLLLQKSGAFSDVADKLGFRTHKGAHVAQVFDYDKDGDLDIYVGYYGSDEANQKHGKNQPSMDGRNGSPHQLFQRGADGKYTEVGAKAGVADVGWTLATTAFDYDNDGDQDLFLANDFGADTFYQNNGDGTFSDVSAATDTADRGSGMNATITDVNGDGFFDLYVSNIDMFSKNIKVVFPTDDSTITNIDQKLQQSFQYLSGNKLFVNPGDQKGRKPFKAEQGLRFEPGDRGWGWASIFFDYENDGDEDMYLSTGWLETSFAANQKKQMFLVEDGFFYLAPPSSPEAFASNGRAAVAVDLDRDGDQDLVLANFRQAPSVFQNTQAKKNHWVGVRLKGTGANTREIGARVTLTAGGKKRMRELSAGNGYLGQMDDVIYIGTGAEAVTSISVKWHGAAAEEPVSVKADQITDVGHKK
jgi:hypothetical protein